MRYTIYHNPRCSKSRQTLKLLQDNGIEPDIVRYLETPPDAATLLDIAARLDRPLAALLRTGEAAYRDASDVPAHDDEPALAAWLAANPSVIERPIVLTSDGQACVGRPPENVLELIDND